jgi:dolichol-phosphate mannosyltransferase
MKLSLIIPAYNESEGVAHTATRLRPVLDTLGRDYALEVVFVDDGSTDNTKTLLHQAFDADARVSIVAHDINRGLGAAVRTGFDYATGDILVTTDFDGTYAFDTIPLLIRQLIDEEADIVTASPYHPAGKVEGVPRYRLLFSYSASLLYRIIVKWRIHTWTALYRAYRRRVIETVSFESNGFLANAELMVNALRAGFKVSEYPATLTQREYGQSSIKVARVTMMHLKYIARLLRRPKPVMRSQPTVTE